MHEFTLPNNLRVVMCPTAGPGVCTLNITYLVGSNCEKIGESGYTHILEHMLFKKSAKFPLGMWQLEKDGATMNATTYLARTNYYETITTDLLYDALEREAARMANPIFEPEALKTELQVVANEYERGVNQPFQVMNSSMLSQAYENAPWRHSTIGTTWDRDHATCEALRAYQKKHYTPANAIVFVTGQFDMEKTRGWITEHFGNIPSGTRAKMPVHETSQTGMRRFSVKGDARIVGIGFKGPKGISKEAVALQVLAYAMNKPVNMFRPLVDSGAVFNVQAEWQRVSHPFLFTVWASAPHVEVAEEGLWKVLKKVHLSQKEFDVCRQALSQKWTNDVGSSQKLALELNEAAARGDWRDVYTRHEVLASLTMEDMLNVKRFLVPERATVGMMSDFETTPQVKAQPYRMGAAPELVGVLNQYSEYTTENGRYITAPGKVHVRLTYDASDCGHAMFTAATLARGYKPMHSEAPHVTEAQVSSDYAVSGVQREATGDRKGVHVRYDGGTEHLVTLQNEVDAPVCSRVSQVRKTLVSETMSKENVVRDMAVAALKKAVFGVRAMPEELAREIHASSRQPLKNCRVTAMAPDKATLEQIQQMFERGVSTPVRYTPVTNPPKEVHVKLPHKASNFVAYGAAAETTLALRLAAGVLGNGFAGRLMQRVRDECGLTYGIYAHARDQLFMVQATFAPRLMARGISEMQKVVDHWKACNVTDQELETQKTMLINSRTVAFDDPVQMATILHGESLRGVTYDEAAVRAVTVDQVHAAIQGLGELTLVKAGTF